MQLFFIFEYILLFNYFKDSILFGLIENFFREREFVIEMQVNLIFKFLSLDKFLVYFFVEYRVIGIFAWWLYFSLILGDMFLGSNRYVNGWREQDLV